LSENQQSKALMAKLIELDGKLEAIEGLLSGQVPLNRKPGAAPEFPDAENPRDTFPESLEHSDNAKSSPSWARSKHLLPLRAAITASEIKNIFQRVDKINRDEEIMARVERLERQNRKVTILAALSITFMILMLAVFTALMFQSKFLNKGVGVLSSQPGESLKPPPVQENAAKVDEPQPPEPVAKLTEPKPAEPMKPVSDETPGEVIPNVTYVGSITSNKYHYPHCKWVAQISPQKLRTFSSVKEAQEQGYIPCPACGAPNHDP
jgi:hypothetical protein